MAKRVLSVGMCGPDHHTLSAYLTKHFDVELRRADGPEDTYEMLRQRPHDLVLINRKLDRDYSDGLDIVRQLKADPQLQQVPVMLITNYPEHQDVAVAAGAARGFGKLEYDKPETLENLTQFLGA